MPATALASASFTILSTSFSLSLEASGLEVLCSSPLPFSLETVDRAGAAVLVEQRQLGGEAGEAPPWLREAAEVRQWQGHRPRSGSDTPAVSDAALIPRARAAGHAAIADAVSSGSDLGMRRGRVGGRVGWCLRSRYPPVSAWHAA
jgi:hypothetical protein